MTTNADYVELEGLLRLRYAEINSLRAEIERLQGIVQFGETASRQQREGHQAEIEHLNEQIQTLVDEGERLKAALRPFAAIADDDRFDDNHPVMVALNGSWVYDVKECSMTWGDFRRARTALEGKWLEANHGNLT